MFLLAEMVPNEIEMKKGIVMTMIRFIVLASIILGFCIISLHAVQAAPNPIHPVKVLKCKPYTVTFDGALVPDEYITQETRYFIEQLILNKECGKRYPDSPCLDMVQIKSNNHTNILCTQEK